MTPIAAPVSVRQTVSVREALDRWFQREILPSEKALTRYLPRVWRTRDEVHDLRQEARRASMKLCEGAVSVPAGVSPCDNKANYYGHGI